MASTPGLVQQTPKIKPAPRPAPNVGQTNSKTSGSVQASSNMLMFKFNFTHQCHLSAEERTSTGNTIPLPPNANYFQRIVRFIKIIILLSPNNPRCFDYFRSLENVQKRRNTLLQQNIFIIHPFSMFRLYYEMFMAVIFIWCMIWFTFNASFYNELVSPTCIVLNYICVFDIFLTFFTGYVNEEESLVVLNMYKIAKNYIFRSTFIFDVATAINPGMVPNASVIQFKAFHLWGIIKIVRIKHCYEYVTRTFRYFKINNTFTTFFKNLFFIFIFIHWIACFIYLTPQIRYFVTGEFAEDRSGWHYGMDSVWNTYIKSMYLASALVLCVHAQQWDERPWEEHFVCILFRSFGKLGVIFITVALVPKILARGALETKYHEIQKQINGFMFKKQLPKVLRDKLNANYQYKYRGYFFQENKITYILSDQLKRDINAEVLSKLAKSVDLFKYLPQKVLEMILSHLKLQIYLPNDLIIKSGVYGDCMYFVASGTVCVSSPSGREVCHLCDGDFFGEVCLIFKDKKRTASVSAIETCEVYKLSKSGFRSCLKSNVDIMNYIKDVVKVRMDMTEAIEEDFLKHDGNAALRK